MEAAHLPWQHLGSLLIDRGLLDVDRTQIEVVEAAEEAPELTFDPIAQREDIAESSDDTPAVKLVHATLAQAIIVRRAADGAAAAGTAAESPSTRCCR